MKHCRDGDGTGTVVFIPGYQDTAALWDGVIDRLPTPGWCARAVNLRHVDDVDPGRRGAILEGYRDQVLEVLHINPTAQSPVVVVGQSMGAQVAELVAAARPNIAVGLALITPVPLPRKPSGDLARLPPRVWRAVRETRAVLDAVHADVVPENARHASGKIARSP